MDDYLVASKDDLLFGPASDRDVIYDQVRKQVTAAVEAVSDDEALEADSEAWAEGLSDEHQIETPTVDVGSADLTKEASVDVDCTGVPGINYSSMEIGGPVIRPGYRMCLAVPYTGNAALLRTYTPSIGMLRLNVAVNDRAIVCAWNWPEVKGSDEFNAEVEVFLRELARGTEEVAKDISRFNASLKGHAFAEIEKRRNKILAERDFLGGLKLPVKRDEQAPKPFRAPPVRPKPSPARQAKKPPTKDPIGSADLSEFYEHILDVIRAVGRGLERSPGSFAGADETVLRDHMLVTLNTHYVGETYAEAFNRKGKTDILIRVYDENVFIGECKWWSGSKALQEALDQLFRYTTWRDSRVALIFYVRAKGITDVIDSAKETLEQREEFIRWERDAHEGELRCRVHWPDDDKREATLTALFVHLPEG